MVAVRTYLPPCMYCQGAVVNDGPERGLCSACRMVQPPPSIACTLCGSRTGAAEGADGVSRCSGCGWVVGSLHADRMPCPMHGADTVFSAVVPRTKFEPHHHASQCSHPGCGWTHKTML